MNNLLRLFPHPGLRVILAALCTLPGRWFVAVPEASVSRRGMPMMYLAVAAFLAAACWLRPVLNPDIRSFHLPLRIWSSAGPTPEEILGGPRAFVLASVGVFLLVLVAVGTLVVWRRPERLGMVAGALLSGSLAANAAVALNHPALIELMDLQYEQRRQISHVIIKSPEKKALTNPHNGRTGGQGGPREDEQRGDGIRGMVYLLYGQWLVLWSVLGVLFGEPGTLLRRGRSLLLWGLLGVGLAGVFCGRRLHAEYYWIEARDREGQGDFVGAIAALDTAVALFPEFERLERTWLLGGKLDYQAGRLTVRERFFRAYQMDRDKETPRAVAYTEDLPWTIKRTPDYRTGLTSSPSGFYAAEKPNAPETGTLYSRERLASVQGPLANDYRRAASRETVRALVLMEELLVEVGDDALPLRHQTARFWINRGLHFYLDRPIIADSEYSFYRHDRRLTAAQHAWARAAQLVPGKRDSAFYLGMAQARIDRERPDLVATALAPLLEELADRPLRAEIEDLLGDTYWEAGRWIEARRHFAVSYDIFSLPKRPNIRAQKRLGGL